MQFQVPQFIETEDKIVGPFTLRQFLYVGIAGAMSFVLFFMVVTWLWAMLTVVLIALSLAFAFVKINGQPLTKIALAAFTFYWKPQAYVWQSENKPAEKKEEAIKSLAEEGFIEKIVSGLMLKSAKEALQTKVQKSKKKVRELEERYMVFNRLSGERHAARRIDYR